MTIHTVTIRKGRKYDQVLMGARSVFWPAAMAKRIWMKLPAPQRCQRRRSIVIFPINKVCSSKWSKLSVNTWQITRWKKLIKARYSSGFKQSCGYMVNFFLSEFSQRMFRICVAEADRIPNWDANFIKWPHDGPPTYRRISAQSAEAGEIEINDFELAADQFAELCKATLWPQAVLEFAVNLTTMKNSGLFQRLLKPFVGLMPRKISAPIFRRALFLVHHDAADAFACMHQIKPFVDVIKA